MHCVHSFSIVWQHQHQQHHLDFLCKRHGADASLLHSTSLTAHTKFTVHQLRSYSLALGPMPFTDGTKLQSNVRWKSHYFSQTMCPPSSPSYKITGHKYDRYGVDGEHFKIDCVYVVVVALLTACDMMTVNVFLLFFVLFAGNLLVYLNGNPLHIHYIIIHATCSMDVGCGLYARRLLFASHVLHALCGGLEVQKKNVEVKSNAFRSLTSSLNYVKEYTIDMDSSSSATAQQRREGSEAKGKVTYKLTQLKRIHSSYQIRWVWGC